MSKHADPLDAFLSRQRLLVIAPHADDETIGAGGLIARVKAAGGTALTAEEIERKVQEYLQAGVRVVWVADPDKLTVSEYRQGRPPRVFQPDDILTVDDVIPGFALKVRDGFH